LQLPDLRNLHLLTIYEVVDSKCFTITQRKSACRQNGTRNGPRDAVKRQNITKLCRRSKCSLSITVYNSTVRDLWIPITERIDYKFGLIVYKCLHQSASDDITHLRKPISSIPARRHLHDLQVPSTSTTKTATRSCRTRKRAFHFYSSGVVRRSHAAAWQVWAVLLLLPPLLLVLLHIGNFLIKN